MASAQSHGFPSTFPWQILLRKYFSFIIYYFTVMTWYHVIIFMQQTAKNRLWMQIQNTVWCQYNAAVYNKTLHTSRPWLRWNVYQSLNSQKTSHTSLRDEIWAVLETKAIPSVRDQQLLVKTRNFLHISLQINVWISQNSYQDRQLFQLSPEHWIWGVFCENFVENWPHYNGTPL